MSLIRVGRFPGRWHNVPVRFAVQQVSGGGRFSGTATFTASPHQGVEFQFTGTANGSGGVNVSRAVAGGAQKASDSAFEIAGGEIVWEGLTTGHGISDPGRPFELRIPSLIKTGTFRGRWHGDAVSFTIQQVSSGGQFRGIAKFTGGPHDGIQFNFSGSLSGSGGLSIARQVRSGTQSAFDPDPQIVGGHCVWEALTTGHGISPPGRPFSLRVPL